VRHDLENARRPGTVSFVSGYQRPQPKPQVQNPNHHSVETETNAKECLDELAGKQFVQLGKYRFGGDAQSRWSVDVAVCHALFTIICVRLFQIRS
jgi:hypothetical protein